MLPVFVINLARRRDRWEAMVAKLKRIGLTTTRIPAIDKGTLTGDRALLKLGAGHVASARSHYRAMRALVASRAPAALILEDDAQVSQAILPCIRSADWWPVGHGLIQLESGRRRELLHLGKSVGTMPNGCTLRPLLRSNVGGCGYLIDREAALEVLEIAPDVPMPLDHLLFHLVNSRLAQSLRPLQVVPGLVHHPPGFPFGSETGSPYVNGRNLWRPPWMIRAWRRLPVAWEIFRGRAERVKISYRG